MSCAPAVVQELGMCQSFKGLHTFHLTVCKYLDCSSIEGHLVN